jgi:hypothetical protein
MSKTITDKKRRFNDGSLGSGSPYEPLKDGKFGGNFP